MYEDLARYRVLFAEAGFELDDAVYIQESGVQSIEERLAVLVAEEKCNKARSEYHAALLRRDIDERTESGESFQLLQERKQSFRDQKHNDK